VTDLLAKAEACHGELVRGGLLDPRARVPQRAPPPGVSTGGETACALNEEGLVEWLRKQLRSGQWVNNSKPWLYPVLKASLPRKGLPASIDRHSDEFEMQIVPGGCQLRWRGGQSLAVADGESSPGVSTGDKNATQGSSSVAPPPPPPPPGATSSSFYGPNAFKGDPVE
jgi:hypothetical protein